MNPSEPRQLVELVLLLLCLVAGGVTDAHASQFSLRFDDLPRLLRERSVALQGAELGVSAAETRTGHLAGSLLPQVSAQAGVEVFRTANYPIETQPFGGIEATLNLYRGGKDRLEEDRRRSEVAQAKAGSVALFRQELKEARTLYWSLVYERNLVKILEEVHKKIVSGQASAERRAAKGLATRTDAMLFGLFSKQVQERMESAKHEDELLQHPLRARFSLDASEALVTPDLTIPHLHDDNAFALASGESMADHPEIHALNGQVGIWDVASRQQARWWTPAIDVYGGYYLYTLRDRTYSEIRDRVDVAGGIRLKMSLFDGLQSKRDADSYKLRMLAAEKEVDARRLGLRSEIESTRGELKHLHELIHNSEEMLELSDGVLKQTAAEYERGVRSSQDLLSGVERWMSIREQDLQRRRDYQKTRARYLTILGQ